MTFREAPKIDNRSAREIFQQVANELNKRLGVDATGVDPMAGALLHIFARYCGLIIQRLNQVPEKNYRAFLDVLNISRIPPTPAQVPLTFSLAEKVPDRRAPIVVPAHTKVATTPAEGESEPVVFETTREIALTNIALEKIIALDPQADRYIDKSQLACCVIPDSGPTDFGFAVRAPVAHEFYVRHEAIFGKPGLSRLTLKFDIARDAVPLIKPMTEWRIITPDGDLSLSPVKDTTSGLTQSGEVIFANLPEWPLHCVFERNGHWLVCRLRHPLQKHSVAEQAMGEPVNKYPDIQAVMLSASWQMEMSPVSMAYFNSLALDLSRDFYPLGERPRFGDVFFVCSNAFAESQTNITLNITLTNPASAEEHSPLSPASKAGDPRIQWEYSNGQCWKKLDYRDTTEVLTENGQVSFTLPSSIQPVTVDGQEGYWIRARLITGNYGEDERLEFTEAGGYRRISSTLCPPSIQAITVSASLCKGPVQPDAIVTHNNFVFDYIRSSSSFIPFQPANMPHKALYLGFRGPNDSHSKVTERAIDLYFHMREPKGRRAYLSDVTARESSNLSWQYWNGQDWKDTSVNDTTESLTMPGVATVRIGEDFAPWRESSLGADLYWIRILWSMDKFQYSNELRRILLNTVLATQTVTLENELLGSSNGTSNQTFHAARKPILRDLQLEIREPEMPEVDEEGRISVREGDDAVTTVHDARGDIEEIWVRWQEVDDFRSSLHGDRHFIVDHHTGVILFGDGNKGRIPPAGINNIRLRRYRTGGGSAGNKPAGAVSQLRTAVPYVASVINLEAAFGGQDIEDLVSLRERGSHWLRHRERGVTVEDYEDMAKLATPEVAKAKCYPNQNRAADPSGESLQPGIVSVVIVPRSTSPKPLPNLTLLRRVRNFLNQRRVPDMNLVVLAPEYVRIHVEAVVMAQNAYSGANVVSVCEDKLQKYLHPVSGGDDGRGWAFGRQPHDSDVYAVLESVQGLSYVQSMHMWPEEDRPGLLESKDFLICSGEHRIRLGF